MEMTPTPTPTDWLRHRASARPEVVAVRDQQGRELTYAELGARARALAERLRGQGQTCVIELGAGIDHAIAIHAAMLAGVPFQTVRPGLPEPERRAVLAEIPGPFELDPGWLGAAGPAPGWNAPRQGAELLARVLTSGSSGVRRSVGLSFDNHYASAAASAFNLGVDPGDRWLCCLPVDHIGGLSILIRSVIYGTGAVLHPRFDPDRVAAEIEAGVTVLSLVPTQLQRLLSYGAPIERLRAILVGGGPLPRRALDEALERGANVIHTYGLTEACSQVCALAAADASRRRGSAGRPLLGTRVAIDGDEVLVQGPTVAPGAAADDGWLRTGDRGRLDESGFLWVEGRIDDLIVSGGENVAPEEVEAVLLAHPAVADAAVVGRPDREWGSAVTAVVVAERGQTIDQAALIEHCRASLAPYKLPKRIELAPELPRSETGKLQRGRLRQPGGDL